MYQDCSWSEEQVPRLVELHKQKEKHYEELLLIMDPSYMNGSAVSPAGCVHVQWCCSVLMQFSGVRFLK